MDLATLESIVEKHMILKDRAIIKLLCSFVISCRLPVRGPWLFLVSASSNGKSMLLESLEGCKLTHVVDDLTPSTLASGMKGKDGQDNSLLNQLNNGSVIVIKDFTTILSKDKEAQKNIIGQLRKIYDGDFVKRFGNGQTVNWHGKISILAGVTSKVHTTMYQLADMGERFLMVTMEAPDREAQGMLATANLDTAGKVKEMRAAFKQFIDGFTIPDKMFDISEETRRDFVRLAEFATKARSAVERNEFSREKEIKMVHFPEMPGRFATQLLVLAGGYMVLNGGDLSIEDKKMLYKISLDSIPYIRRLCLQALTEYKEVETTSLAVHLKYPVNTLRLFLQDLAALKVIDYTKQKNRDTWMLHDNYRELMAKYEGIKMTDKVLEGLEAAPAPDPDFVGEGNKVLEKAISIIGGEVVI